MLCTVRTRAPEEVLHTSYTEVSTLKAGFLLEWGACLALHSGKFKMVFLTLHIPRSAITSHMTHLLCSYSAAGDGEHSGCVHKVHMTDIRVRDLGFTLNPWKNKYTACRLSLHVTVHVSPVSEKLNGHSMAPVFNVQDFASELVRGQFADQAPDDPNHGHKGADKLCAIAVLNEVQHTHPVHLHGLEVNSNNRIARSVPFCQVPWKDSAAPQVCTSL